MNRYWQVKQVISEGKKQVFSIITAKLYMQSVSKEVI